MCVTEIKNFKYQVLFQFSIDNQDIGEEKSCLVGDELREVPKLVLQGPAPAVVRNESEYHKEEKDTETQQP